MKLEQAMPKVIKDSAMDQWKGSGLVTEKSRVQD